MIKEILSSLFLSQIHTKEDVKSSKLFSFNNFRQKINKTKHRKCHKINKNEHRLNVTFN